MTDKEIIIDGVDVSECEHINTCDNKIKCVILQDDVCETNPYCEGYNCYYKQSKHKNQEYEKLKKQVEIFTRQLEKANREVIKEKEKNATQRQENATQLQENDKLKQTLAEIKEIAENMNNECFYNDFSCDGCDMINGCTYQGKIKVLQKIREVKE